MNASLTRKRSEVQAARPPRVVLHFVERQQRLEGGDAGRDAALVLRPAGVLLCGHGPVEDMRGRGCLRLDGQVVCPGCGSAWVDPLVALIERVVGKEEEAQDNTALISTTPRTTVPRGTVHQSVEDEHARG